MSYKVYLWGSLGAVEWSQAVWKIEGRTVSLDDCDQELLHSVLLEYLPRSGLIVDAGCGTGRWPIYFHRLGYRMIGVEICHEACVIARENQPGVNMIEADVRRMPLRAGSLDAVLSLGVVEHDEAGPLAALRETRRVLKPGGLLILAVPYNNLFRRLIVNRAQTYVTWKRRRADAELRFGEYRFNKREVSDFLRRTGFEVAASYPNDALPPKTVGLWVDYNNLVSTPYGPPPTELFLLPGMKGRIARALMRWVPWLVCGELAVVARAR